jgi:hypothetical protein
VVLPRGSVIDVTRLNVASYVKVLTFPAGSVMLVTLPLVS